MDNGLNRTTILGNVGRDGAKLQNLPDGTPVANFSVAVNHSYRDGKGNKVEKETWFKVAIFGKRGEAVAKYITQGTLVFCAGRVGVEEPWEKNGKWTAGLTLTVGNEREDFMLLNSSGGSAENETLFTPEL